MTMRVLLSVAAAMHACDAFVTVPKPGGRSDFQKGCPAKAPNPGEECSADPTLVCLFGKICCPDCPEYSADPCSHSKEATCTAGAWELVSVDPACIFDDQCVLNAPTPEVGTLVIDGKFGNEVECVTDPTQTTAGPHAGALRGVIAAQCCESNGDCKRKLDCPEGGDACCVAGHSLDAGGITPNTYESAKEVCELEGLQLCDGPCRNYGCWYNRHPVWTSRSCVPS